MDLTTRNRTRGNGRAMSEMEMNSQDDISDVYTPFLELHPEWDTFDHPTAYITRMPPELPKGLWGFLDQYIHHNSEYKYVCTVLASILDIPPTGATGREPLLKELGKLFNQLGSARLDRALDGLGALSLAFAYGKRLDEINDMFAECKLGYKLVNDTLNKLHWELVVQPTKKSPKLQADSENKRGATLLETCTYAHKMTSSARDKLYAKEGNYIQGALADNITAVGLLLGLLSGEMDIRRAKARLESQNCAGINTIIGDGLFIWTHLENYYKHITNNLEGQKVIADEEVFYWADRIDAFVSFFQKRL